MGTRQLVLLDYVGEGFVCCSHVVAVLAVETLRGQQVLFGGTAEASDGPASSV